MTRRSDVTAVQSANISLNARTPARELSTAEHRARSRVEPRAFWLAQCRMWLEQARFWSERFGGDDHDAALGWYLHALLEADRYRRWARELAPALRPVRDLLEAAS